MEEGIGRCGCNCESVADVAEGLTVPMFDEIGQAGGMAFDVDLFVFILGG